MGKIIDILDANEKLLSSEEHDGEVFVLIAKDKNNNATRIGMKLDGLQDVEDMFVDLLKRSPMTSAPMISAFVKRFLELFNETVRLDGEINHQKNTN